MLWMVLECAGVLGLVFYTLFVLENRTRKEKEELREIASRYASPQESKLEPYVEGIEEEIDLFLKNTSRFLRTPCHDTDYLQHAERLLLDLYVFNESLSLRIQQLNKCEKQ